MRRLNKKQVARIDALIDGLDKREIPPDQAAYILATAFHETDAFKTLEEYATGANYEGRKDLGNTHDGDGQRFKGRGYVQITGRRNYADWSKRLGVNLVGKPWLAKDLNYAVPIIIEGMLKGTFTSRKLSTYFTSTKKDWIQARRIVNRLDRAAIIGRYAERIYGVIKEKGDDE